MYIILYIYIYVERERERDRQNMSTSAHAYMHIHAGIQTYMPTCIHMYGHHIKRHICFFIYMLCLHV